MKTKFKGKPTQSGSSYENRRGFNFSKKILDKITRAYEPADSIEILPAKDDINGNGDNYNNDAETDDKVTDVTEVTHSIDRQDIIEDNFDINESKRTLSKEDNDDYTSSNIISNNSSNQINRNNDNGDSTHTSTYSKNMVITPYLPLRSVTSVTSVTESKPCSAMFTKEKRKGDNDNNTILLSGLPKIPCIFCTYSNPIRFDLGLHLIEKHRMDLVKLRIGKASMDVRVDYAIELGATRFSLEDEDDGIYDKADDEEKEVNVDY